MRAKQESKAILRINFWRTRSTYFPNTEPAYRYCLNDRNVSSANVPPKLTENVVKLSRATTHESQYHRATKPVNSRKIAAYVDDFYLVLSPSSIRILFSVGGGQKTKMRKRRPRCAKLGERMDGTTRRAEHFFSWVIGVQTSLCNWYRCVLAVISLRSISRRLHEPLVEWFAPYDAWSTIKIKGHGTTATSPLLFLLLFLFHLCPLYACSFVGPSLSRSWRNVEGFFVARVSFTAS